jgi:hypothetical protein
VKSLNELTAGDLVFNDMLVPEENTWIFLSKKTIGDKVKITCLDTERTRVFCFVLSIYDEDVNMWEVAE